MATPATGAPGDGHQQSIGADSPLPVDGIAGGHAGLQEPAGAHVDAGAPDASKPAGVSQPSGRSGAPGRGRAPLAGRRAGDAQPLKYNGSLARGGTAVGVFVGCGSLGRQGV